ncbi:DUF3857 domain-containing transglutaminase family protein [Halotalea alkalilenta]|uniref:DUF3857 domain-containing transglutaminase family protein n=1 Tax=Halotalea alkalilenta TaxID=376489 RepID=UPI000693F0EE|nr:DUF3857 domain-containing protein [Halotalea alkalilenta]
MTRRFPALMMAALLVVLGPLLGTAYAAVPANFTLLYEQTHYQVEMDGRFVATTRVGMRLDSERAVTEMKPIRLPYSSTLADQEALEAWTIDDQGRRHEVASGRIIDQPETATGTSTFTDLRVVSIDFPNPRLGGELHYVVRYTQQVPYFEGWFSVVANVSPSMPTAYKEISIDAPAGMALTSEVRGFIEDEAETREGRRHYRWTLTDQPSRLVEPHEPSSIDSGPRLAVSSFSDHGQLAAAYRHSAQGKARVTPAIQRLADRITTGIEEPREQAKALYEWTSREIRYVALFLERGGFVPHDAETVLDARYGDCKDYATLLEALLAAKGIDSRPVMVNASETYWHPAMPVMIYDHMINYLPQFGLFVDATPEMAPFATLMPSLAGKTALVIEPDGFSLATLPVAANRQTIETEATLDENGVLAGRTAIEGHGYPELINRHAIGSVRPGAEASYASQLLSRDGYRGQGRLEHSEPRDLSTPFAYALDFSLEDYAWPEPGERLPFPASLGAISGLRNFIYLGAQPERHQPFICLPIEYRERVSIALPEGDMAEVLLPPDVDQTTALGRYRAEYRRIGMRLEVERQLSFEPQGGPIGPTVCGSQDHPTLKALTRAMARDLDASARL